VVGVEIKRVLQAENSQFNQQDNSDVFEEILKAIGLIKLLIHMNES